MPRQLGILVLGLGNRLLSDDAVGPLVVDLLAERLPEAEETGIMLRDGGTMGLSLLPDIEDAQGLIAIDAASFGEKPGTMRVFEGAAMDALLGGVKKTAHEVALGDLMGAAALRGSQPQWRALVAVQPALTTLGLEPTPAVAPMLPAMADAVLGLIARWQQAMEQGLAVDSDMQTPDMQTPDLQTPDMQTDNASPTLEVLP